MKWAEIFDLPCGCKRVPDQGVLVQRWEDICATHQSEAESETGAQKQMREGVLIAEELQEMALERLKAKGKI
jgi:hypothetical protein